MVKEYGNYVNGKFDHKTNDSFISYSPSTEEPIGSFPETSPKAVQEAVAVARSKFDSWRKLSRIVRAEYFDKLAQILSRRSREIVDVISTETGKSLNESTAEVNEALHMTQYTFAQGREQIGRMVASEIAEKDVTIFRKPKGVVAVIAPWNFPFAIGGFWTSAPALLEGNTVVFKPSEDTPLTGQIIAELYHEAGFPSGVFNVVHGCGEKTGAALVHADVNHICFTGSAAVGQFIRRHCADVWNKSSSCELGSKSACIVFDDIDIDMAVAATITSAFRLSGQRCVSGGRVLVHRRVYKEFVKRFTAAAQKLVVGDPYETPAPDFGPLINKDQVERVMKFNEKTKGKAEIFLEGKRLDRKGHYLTPHVIGSEWFSGDESRSFLQEEVFGPHVVLIPFDNAEDAVRIYNDTPYGLSMSVLTNNMHVARYMRDNCEFGLGYMNLPCIGAESHIPFGGIKKSGSGGSSAAGSFHAVTHEVTWTANYDSSGFKMCQGLK